MEIKLNAGDKITIPTGCKATIEDDLIVIEEKQEDFKDGDILHSNITGRVVIFKSYENDSCKHFCTYYNSANTSNNAWFADCFYPATEEEKQAFFDDLKAKGLKWNDETKQMEKIRKRAKKGREYLIVNRFGDVVKLVDEHSTFDDMNYNLGNYFFTRRNRGSRISCKIYQSIF